jgi:hypothetical protein
MGARNTRKNKVQIHTEKQTWKHTSKTFTVEVARWSDCDKENKENKWNIYAYIYPKNPLFEKITSESLYDYGADIPMHGGTTFHCWHFGKDGLIKSKQIGCDYQHLCDDRFLTYVTKESAWEIFRDADDLIEYLKNTEERVQNNAEAVLNIN